VKPDSATQNMPARTLPSRTGLPACRSIAWTLQTTNTIEVTPMNTRTAALET
jgi:hypothetical protein